MQQHSENLMRIFCDFDGTITLRDTDSELFREVEELQALQQQYVRRQIPAQEYWTRITTLSRPFSDDEFATFFKTFAIDETFVAFAQFCSERAIPLYVVSDGMDFYIKGMFAARGIDLPIFANAATVIDGKIAVTFPHTYEHCVGNSANCKCSHVMRLTPEGESIVYIGNGTSDTCPAQRSDIIFAKHRLARFCEEQNIPYHNFHTFTEIREQLEKYLLRSKPYIRSAAEIRRKELWAQE